ncbi:carbonic anhydrase [Pararoseomonas indoligenes]|uniref:carbonic anhydrase n=1 Tax=Roseomonas indoligenes TaxID=2820811 RepID=A0A940MU99_9PROT|nr:carbonic anhydrase [Pararoseomonas indoligenes]MBP0493549.1 carbonic anhydrase [Pararoseomonas indoligenes]
MPDDSCGCCAKAALRGRAGGRRGLLCAGLGALTAPAALAPARAADPVPHTRLTPDEALTLLKRGNDEFRHEEPFSFPHGHKTLADLSRGQAPFVVLVGCSDSRVPPELLFGRGLGEMFIVRNAGNTVDTAALGSIEYGVGVLGCPLVVVMGHQSCGAVAASLEMVEHNTAFPGVIGEMVQPILPAVLSARRPDGTIALDDAVVANARRVAARIKTQSVVLQDAIRAGRLKVVAARYELETGDVRWLEEG